MRNHILLGRGRSINKKDLFNALHYGYLTNNLTNKIGSGTSAIKKNFGGKISSSSEKTVYKNKQFKPLKFKM